MSGADTGPSWSSIAGWYDDLVESGSGPHETAVDCLLDLAGDLDGAAVLDVGCGQGLGPGHSPQPELRVWSASTPPKR
ncbi:MAG: hypothetical protein ACR2MA_01140 [Egibacteraceae bacterium]